MQNDRLDSIALGVIATCHVQQRGRFYCVVISLRALRYIRLVVVLTPDVLYTVHLIRFVVFVVAFLSAEQSTSRTNAPPPFHSFSRPRELKQDEKREESRRPLHKLSLHNSAGCGESFQIEMEIVRFARGTRCLECGNNFVSLSCMQNRWSTALVPFASERASAVPERSVAPLSIIITLRFCNDDKRARNVRWHSTMIGGCDRAS